MVFRGERRGWRRLAGGISQRIYLNVNRNTGCEIDGTATFQAARESFDRRRRRHLSSYRVSGQQG